MQATFTISFNANGGSSTPEPQGALAGENVTITKVEPTRNDYLFLGWNTNSSATTPTYKAGDTISVNSDMILYAIWKEGTIDKLTFTLNSSTNTYSVKKLNSSMFGEVVIPGTYNNLPVTEIKESAFQGRNGITSVLMPNTITSMERYVFQNCSSLTSITIPEGVNAIGNSAFNNCSSLTSITIPEGVTSIGGYAFYGCSGLTTVNYTGTEAQWKAISIGSSNTPLTNATINYLYG